MIVRVVYFASLRDGAGTSEETVELPDDSSVAELWASLTERHVAFRELRIRPLAACDLTYAEWDSPLGGVSEVAFLPPVSGG